MITHQSICKTCGNQTEIDQNTKSFQAVLKVYPLKEHSFNDTFGDNSWFAGNKKTTSLADQIDWINESFCDKECFIEYLKEKMTDGGTLKLSQEEIEQLEEEQPEVKEIKRISKTLRDLEQMANPAMGASQASTKGYK